MVLIPVLLVVILLLVILFLRAARFGAAQGSVPPAELAPIPAETVAGHLAEVVRVATISHDSASQTDEKPFHALHALLQKLYPGVHKVFKRELVGGLSLLYTWEGSDPALKPILLTSHQDVVPVEAGTESLWEHPPFGGEIADGYVWGRGTIDIKNGVVGILEAVEHLISQGYQPKRTIYIGFGHDEEVLGMGAPQMAAALASRGVELEYVLDEGGSVVDGMMPGVAAPVALLGTAEKGYLTLELSVENEGGHSAMPMHPTTIGLLSAAVQKLEAHPFPARLDNATPVFKELGRYLPFGMQIAFANLWLFRPLIIRQLAANHRTNAMLRTTMAVTLFHSGMKENVLPRSGSVTVNLRLLPGDTVKEVIERVKAVIHDGRVTVRVLQHEAPISLPEINGVKPLIGGYASPNPQGTAGKPSAAYRMLAQTVQQVFPGAATAPFLVLGATDARHYSPLSPNVFRFTPIHVDEGEMSRVHGLNERLSIENCQKSAQFFVQLIRNTEDLAQ